MTETFALARREVAPKEREARHFRGLRRELRARSLPGRETRTRCL